MVKVHLPIGPNTTILQRNMSLPCHSQKPDQAEFALRARFAPPAP